MSEQKIEEKNITPITDNQPQPIDLKSLQQIVGIVMAQQQSWVGPLPRPEDLAAFGQIDKSLPDRIMKLAEENNRANIVHRSDTLRSAAEKDHSGQWLGFWLAIATIATSGIVTGLGYEVYGSILGGSTLVSLVTVFITGRSSKK